MTKLQKKVKPLKLEFNTEREIAEYYFNREFNTCPLELVKNEEGFYETMKPNRDLIIKDYFDAYSNKEELIAEYLEENDDLSNFYDWVEERQEYEDYKYGDWESNNEPMWGWVFACPDFYVDSDYCNVDDLYKIGIGVIEHETGYYLFISGAGYDFYDAHWIPLFKHIGWISYEEELETA